MSLGFGLVGCQARISATETWNPTPEILLSVTLITRSLAPRTRPSTLPSTLDPRHSFSSPPTCSVTTRANTRPRSVSSRVLASTRPKMSRRGATRAGPARLVAGPEPRAVVTVEVLVKQNQIAPMRIVLELGRAAVDRPLSIGIAQKSARQPADKLLRHFEQRHVAAGTGRALNLEFVAVEVYRFISARTISALTGIHTGPRQLELPPNMPVFDSAGRYWTLYS